MHIRKSDTVVLLKSITGNPDRERGFRGRVLRVMPQEGKLIVEGVAYRYKHVRPTRENPSGGRITREGTIDLSNVRLYCPTCDKGVKTTRSASEGGTRQRRCTRCGNVLPEPTS